MPMTAAARAERKYRRDIAVALRGVQRRVDDALSRGHTQINQRLAGAVSRIDGSVRSYALKREREYQARREQFARDAALQKQEMRERRLQAERLVDVRRWRETPFEYDYFFQVEGAWMLAVEQNYGSYGAWRSYYTSRWPRCTEDFARYMFITDPAERVKEPVNR